MYRSLPGLILVFLIIMGSAFTSSEAFGKNRSFKGLVISHDQTYVEVKKKSKEMTFYFDENSKVITHEGKEGNAGSLKLCQLVTVSYTVREGKNVVASIKINKESECYK